MEYQYKCEEYDFNIVFNEFLLKYFDPLELKAEPVIFNSIKKGVTNEQYAEQLETARRSHRWCRYDFYTASYIDESGTEILHPDYDIPSYASKTLFKMDLQDLEPEYLVILESFVFEMKELIMLYVTDHWAENYSKMNSANTGTSLFYDVEDIRSLRMTLEKLENLDKSEVVLRKKDKYGAVITSETQKLNANDLKMVLHSYAKQKYYEFVYRYNIFNHLSTEAVEEVKANILNIPTDIRSLADDHIAHTIDMSTADILERKGFKPTFTSEYFVKLESQLTAFLVRNRIDPLYEFLKLLVPRLNKALDENGHTKYRKKDKHLFIFSLLRSACLIPDKETLGLEGHIDVKEDFIKQLLR